MGKDVLIGAHMSITGGVHLALLRAKEIGATVMQIFTANQRSWRTKKITPQEIELWKKTKKETGISHIMSHDSYLINLGSYKKPNLEKSRKAFLQEIERCNLLDIDYLNFHPGSALEKSEQFCLDTISQSILGFEKVLKKGKTKLVLEMTAGQGTNVGYKFEHMAYIINKVKKKIPIGVCIDTCHIFAAGYDIRDKKGWLNTLKEFDKIIGIKYLLAFHVNDSVHVLGSRKDRHASIGKGKIGIKSFQFLMSYNKTKNIPKYLETPIGDKWVDEIKLLKKFAKDAYKN